LKPITSSFFENDCDSFFGIEENAKLTVMLSGDEDFAGIVGRAHLILRGDVESVIVQAKVGEHRVAGSVFRLNQGSRES